MGIAKLREEGKAYKLTPETARAAVETRWRNARLRKQKELEDAMIAANARKP